MPPPVLCRGSSARGDARTASLAIVPFPAKVEERPGFPLPQAHVAA